MTANGRDFIDFWIQNSVHAGEQYGTRAGSQAARDLTSRCLEMAASQGISRAEMEKEIGDILNYMKPNQGRRPEAAFAPCRKGGGIRAAAVARFHIR
jgi:hypothetical protein